MRFDIITLFPDMVKSVLGESIIGRAQANGVLEVYTHQIRDYSEDKHHRVDDTPYGGGMGMLMSAPPIAACYDDIVAKSGALNRHTIYMSPRGRILSHKKAAELSRYDQLVMLCGHYEGVDQRVIDEIADEEISIGDYILTGGELPACILCDCVGRLCSGVLSDSECHEKESIACGLLEYPQYTRPYDFRGRKVPDVLCGGNHADIEKWRYEAALAYTRKNRPDLL